MCMIQNMSLTKLTKSPTLLRSFDPEAVSPESETRPITFTPKGLVSSG